MDATTTTLTETHRSVVTEDQIDHLGHMNVRFYGMNATSGTRALLEELGAPSGTRPQFVDVYTRHHREQLLGARLVVRSGIVEFSDDALGVYHELANEDTGVLAATFVHRVRPELGHGEPVAWPEAVVARAAARCITIPPQGATRSISLTTDPIATAPSLETLRTRGLAIRKARAVSADECDADGTYLPAMAAALVWGGEPIDRRFPELLHEGPNGERMGWASMETRMAIRRLPRRGDHVQSFSAVVALGDKVMQNVMWAYDVDADELLMSFEVVNLAFDVGGRRPMQIPEALRNAESTLLHPDLAPR